MNRAGQLQSQEEDAGMKRSMKKMNKKKRKNK